MTPDSELLHEFARTNSEDAFAEVVKRHVNLVYSAALRQVNGDAHLAQDVAQTVFTDLAEKAASLSRRDNLSGWLYTSAHFAAAKIVRGENRRRDREEKFMREPENNATDVSPVQSAGEADWEKLRPMLDEVMHELKETDREAILLRYFENRPFAEVGAKLGLNENAARMRVERALEKLRAVFAKRGVTATATLASVISANAVQLAPAGLAATLAAGSIVSAGTGTITLLKIMTATKLKLGFSALVVAGAATALVVQHQTQTKLNEENQSLRQQMTQLQNDNESLSNRVATINNSESLPKDQFNELLKLRGEVGVLRRRLESEKAQAIQQSTASRESSAAHLAPNAYISKNQFTNAGLDTAEAALQTWMHSMLAGDIDQMTNASASFAQPADLLTDPKKRDEFEKKCIEEASSFQGQQILAKKIVSDDRVDLEVLFFQEGKFPDTTIQRMVKEGNQWKFAGSYGVSPSSSSDNQIQLFAPSAGQ